MSKLFFAKTALLLFSLVISSRTKKPPLIERVLSIKRVCAA